MIFSNNSGVVRLKKKIISFAEFKSGGIFNAMATKGVRYLISLEGENLLSLKNLQLLCITIHPSLHERVFHVPRLLINTGFHSLSTEWDRISFHTIFLNINVLNIFILHTQSTL